MDESTFVRLFSEITGYSEPGARSVYIFFPEAPVLPGHFPKFPDYHPRSNRLHFQQLTSNHDDTGIDDF